MMAVMQARDIQPGRLYARRDPPNDPHRDVEKVQPVTAPRARQVKVKHVSGELDGLEEWVTTRSLLCAWGERQGFLRDERLAHDLRSASDESRTAVEEEAISHVLTATGEEGGFARTWSLSPEKARRLWQRAKLSDDPTQSAYAYIDRSGALHLSYDTALRFAQAFAAAEPEPCLLFIKEWEDRLRAEGYEPGNRYAHSLLREWAPSHALVRQWASQMDSDRLEEELERVRKVVDLAIRLLKETGAEAAARRVELALGGR
jgi:hypothetical protein